MDRTPSRSTRSTPFRLPLAVPPALQRPVLATRSAMGQSPALPLTTSQRTPVIAGGSRPMQTPLNARFSQQHTRFDGPHTPRRPRPLARMGTMAATTPGTRGSSALALRRPAAGPHRTPGTASRPTTAHSPGTAAPTYNEDSGLYTAALFETPHPVQRDVGIAAINMVTGTVALTQLNDTTTYHKTIQFLRLHPPATIVVPQTGPQQLPGRALSAARELGEQQRTHSLLCEYLQDAFRLPIYPLGRKFWSAEQGQKTLDKALLRETSADGDGQGDAREGQTEISPAYGSNSPSSVKAAVAGRTCALSAMAALFTWVQHIDGQLLLDKSIRVRWVPLEGTVAIDYETATNLELVFSPMGAQNSLWGTMLFTATSARKLGGPSSTGLTNRAVPASWGTPMTRRLLRSNMLQPLSNTALLDSRLDSVDELVRDDERRNELDHVLTPLRTDEMDIDALSHRLIRMNTPRGDPGSSSASGSFDGDFLPPPTPQVTDSRIQLILKIKAWLMYIRPVAAALRGAGTALLQTVNKYLTNADLSELASVIDTVINPHVILGRGGLIRANARVSAVLPDQNPLLDVARQSYKENLEDIFALAQQYSVEYDMQFTAKYRGSGFVLEVRTEDADATDFPSDTFINVHKMKNGKGYTMSSLDLKKTNRRMADMYDRVMILSGIVVEDLILQIVDRIASLYKASEGIGILDLLHLFASTASVYNYVRPQFGSVTAIVAGRHPMLDRRNGAHGGGAVPNDVYITPVSGFQVIVGPNMAGKSTYIRSAALLTIMSLLGSYVPADNMTVSPPDAILASLPAPDSLESGLSHFGAEMRACASIAGGATAQSLVLLDEVGRGTSSHEAFGIVYALAEHLLTRVQPSCPAVFLATHDKQLVTILDGSADVVVRHLAVQLEANSTDASAAVKIHFPHRVQLGDPPEDQTAIDLASHLGLPSGLVERAQAHTRALALLQSQNSSEEQDRIDALKRRKAAFRIHTTLEQLLRDAIDSDTPEPALAQHLLAIQQIARDTFGATVQVETSDPAPLAADDTLLNDRAAAGDLPHDAAPMAGQTRRRSYSVTSPATSAMSSPTCRTHGAQAGAPLAALSGGPAAQALVHHASGSRGHGGTSTPASAAPSRLSWVQQLDSL